MNALNHTFGQFLGEFRTDFGGWSRNTWRGLSGMLRKLDEEFGDKPLESLTSRQIERYLTRRRNVDGITPATTKGEAGNKGCSSRIGHGADCVVPVAVEVMPCEIHS